jgi:hypothetical protein
MTSSSSPSPAPADKPSIRRTGVSIFLLFAILIAPLHSAEFFLAPDGDDAADGSRTAPWASLETAASRLQPGDRLSVLGGVYRLNAPARIRAQGTPRAWITITAADGDRPIFDGAEYRPARGTHDTGLLDLDGSAFLRLEGLEVRNSHGMGIHVVHPSHHVDIVGCRVENTYGPGIGVWGIPRELIPIEHVRVLGNEVTRTNLVAMEIHPGPHEPPHEAISIAGVHHFEVAYNHVHHVGKEGIDVKEYSAHGRVHHNLVHHAARQGLYVDAWFGPLHDVTFDHNRVHSNEWGMGISCEGPNSSLQRIFIHHNVFAHHRGSGIYFTLWGGDRHREQIFIYNNTLVDNGSVDHWSGPTGNLDLRSSAVARVAVFNNLSIGGAAFNLASFMPPEEVDTLREKQAIFLSHNLFDAFVDQTDAAPYLEGYGRNHALRGDHPILADPRLRAPGEGDYRPATDFTAHREGLAAAPDGTLLPGLSPEIGAGEAAGPLAPEAPRGTSRLFLAD